MVNFYNAYVTCSDKATLSDVAGEEVPRWVGGGSDPPALLTPVPPHRPHGLCEEGGRCPGCRLRRGLRRGLRVKGAMGWDEAACPHHGDFLRGRGIPPVPCVGSWGCWG